MDVCKQDGRVGIIVTSAPSIGERKKRNAGVALSCHLTESMTFHLGGKTGRLHFGPDDRQAVYTSRNCRVS